MGGEASTLELCFLWRGCCVKGHKVCPHAAKAEPPSQPYGKFNAKVHLKDLGVNHYVDGGGCGC